ncbi:MAG: glycine zipper 2TM domain-containing protein [Gammaproteobacteria bacterium]|nr:glycine zipper 2TM domain-containing protein [Gammaproteobacteria bacterium]
MNSRILTTGAVLALALSQAALADSGRRGRNHDRGHETYARVVAVEPMIEHVRYTVPVENCWVESRERGYANKTSAAIVGGAVGALIGNNIGRGDGRRAATLGGAFVGAVLGSEAARRDTRAPRYEEVQRCQTHHEERFEERVSGYRVTYVYDGRRGVTRLPHEPGRYIRVAVDVHPLG